MKFSGERVHYKDHVHDSQQFQATSLQQALNPKTQLFAQQKFNPNLFTILCVSV
jgi:NADPH-dependent 7-cyano-7-deazaguanine reductase QueF